jgi:hydantoinase/carbamoylase family amidase
MDAEMVMVRADQLARCTEEPGRITRRFATPALAAAQEKVEGWMRDDVLQTRRDAVTNLFGRYGTGSRRLLIGSHLDTVPDGGKYDGALGVLVALAVVERLAAREARLPFAVEVCSFADEESVRYGTAYLGSSALAGRFDPGWLDRADRDGIHMRDALKAAGGDPAKVATCAIDPADAVGWIELHIEQGPVLEAEGLPIGVVTAIQGMTRLDMTVTGAAGHAGTTPMAGRRDALAGAAEAILAIEQVGRSTDGLVATVGVIDARPGAMNVIPGSVSFSVDVRHPDDAVRTAATDRIRAEAAAVCARRGLELAEQVLFTEPAVPCDPGLRDLLGRAIGEQGLAVRELPSGAGHDAAALAAICPVSMLFLRCRGGISHNPAESVEQEDVAVALAVLERAILDLAAAA